MTPLTATTTTATTPVAAEAVRTTAPTESAAPAATPGTTPAADRAGAGDGSPPLDQLDALEADHDYLTEGDVFTPDLIDTWIEYKRDNEIVPMRMRPHPYEFELYYDL